MRWFGSLTNFRGRKTPAPLKVFGCRLRRVEGGHFRGRKTPAPLKGRAEERRCCSGGYFRGRKTPAPLKGSLAGLPYAAGDISGVERPRPH